VITRDGAVLPGVPPGLISELPTNAGFHAGSSGQRVS
jgi:hypothetical protein